MASERERSSAAARFTARTGGRSLRMELSCRLAAWSAACGVRAESASSASRGGVSQSRKPPACCCLSDVSLFVGS